MAGELLPNNTTATYAGIPFLIPRTDTTHHDLVSCEGQSILIPEGRYTKVALLGLSTWGDFFDYIQVFYRNGTISELPFGFNDWQCSLVSHESYESNSNLFMEYIRYQDEIINFRTKLEIQTIQLDPNLEVEELKLLDNTYSYILAISLQRSDES
ncbi:hypothetical protein D3C77_580790 [compost metagenome]